MARGVKGTGKKTKDVQVPGVPSIEDMPEVGEDPTMVGWIRTLSPMRQSNGQRSTTLTINQRIYKFVPNAHGAYVAQVPFPKDYAAILSIGAGYEPYDHPEGTKVSKTKGPAPTSRVAGKAEVQAKPPRGPAKPNAPRPGVPAQTIVVSADPAAG